MTTATQARVVKAFLWLIAAACIVVQFTLHFSGSKTDPRHISENTTPQPPPAASPDPPGSRSATAIAADNPHK